MGNTCGGEQCRERPRAAAHTEGLFFGTKKKRLANGPSTRACLFWCVPALCPSTAAWEAHLMQITSLQLGFCERLIIRSTDSLVSLSKPSLRNSLQLDRWVGF